MQNIKDNTHQKLMETGRALVVEKGAEFLTARKLSEASGCSIGTIYNQFNSMDDFIVEQNELTLSELYEKLINTEKSKRAYQNINNYVDAFVNFVLENQQLWFLLFNFHLNNKNYVLPNSYKKLIVKLSNIGGVDMFTAFPLMDTKRLKLAQDVLWLALIALSSMLTTNILDNMSLVNKNNLCKLMLNTYLAGMMLLNKN